MELFNGDEFKVDEAMILESLSTGLFSSRGQYWIGWSHQMYAEFLAARFLLTHGATVPQILSLILHPFDKKVIPQLGETVAWLAGMYPEVFEKLLETYPEVLLRSDFARAGRENRKRLTQSLLQFFDEGKLLDTNWELRWYYAKLHHPGLAEQARPYIQNS